MGQLACRTYGMDRSGIRIRLCTGKLCVVMNGANKIDSQQASHEPKRKQDVCPQRAKIGDAEKLINWAQQAGRRLLIELNEISSKLGKHWHLLDPFWYVPAVQM